MKKLVLSTAAALLLGGLATTASAGNEFIWCLDKQEATKVTSAYKLSSFKHDRLTLDHIRGATGNQGGCGLTSDKGMVTGGLVASFTTSDGKNLNGFQGTGKRVMLPVNF